MHSFIFVLLVVGIVDGCWTVSDIEDGVDDTGRRWIALCALQKRRYEITRLSEARPPQPNEISRMIDNLLIDANRDGTRPPSPSFQTVALTAALGQIS